MLVLFAAVATALFAAEKKTLTNADVIKMVKAELPEATILLAIQANPHEFDPSVDALIELKTNGVPAKVIEAMLQPASAAVSAPTAPQPSTDVQGPPGADAREQKTRPYAFTVSSSGERARLQALPFKIIETKAKGNSVAMLLTESAVTEVAGEVVMNGAVNVLLATGGRFLGTVGGAAAGLTSAFGKKLFKSDEVTLTYVYALGGRESSRRVAAEGAKFEVYYADVFGADPDEFEPVIIKVSPTPKNWRMVGAMKAKKSEFDDQAPRELNIIEERIPTSLKKLARGNAEITPSAVLEPGEYAVVLRPTDAKRKISLHEFEHEQGEGIVLRSLWDFRVQPPQPVAPEQKS